MNKGQEGREEGREIEKERKNKEKGGKKKSALGGKLRSSVRLTGLNFAAGP